MVMTNSERMGKALDLLRNGMRPKCEETWQGFYGDDWLQIVNQRLHNPQRKPTSNDILFLFNGIKATWNEVFSHAFGPEVRGWVFEAAEARNTWAHQGSFTSDDVLRTLDSMERLLGEFGDTDNRQKVKALRRDLMRQIFEEESRGQGKKAAAKATESRPQAGLTPWRDVIKPHDDVASGGFEQAEFAADLYEVASGTADDEYQDPKAFFARTYLTEGLRKLLVDAAKRLSGQGGDPVIELQTNFGGGKTHSMIALYHLASAGQTQELPGISEELGEKGVSMPADINRAVLVGQTIRPAKADPAEDGIELHTLWGRLAYQLGGKAGYELVRADDEAGTNPGDALRTLFQQFGPAIVLIDEWVAYARQLFEAGEGRRLPGGDFDTQFTFAQSLTEAAAAVDNVVLLVSIPSSDIEVGGDQGKTALERLKNVVTRVAAQWQSADNDESFEIVRRRLFETIPEDDDKARARAGVIRAFSEMYRKKATEFPSESSEGDYRQRLERSYPFHPELFDRLFNDWSALDKFQRTRGVLRLMASAVSELWQRNDQSLLIMPGNLPMDHGPLVSEMKKYLEEGWDPVIKGDVDGANSRPLRIDKEHTQLGQLSATRRAARTVYMGSAAKPVRSRGVDVKRIMLGCVQPGEPVNQFGAALRRLSGEATHLYVDGAQYWYGLQPNVNRLATDRAASNYDDRDADDLIKEGVSRQTGRGEFSAVQVFAEGPGDVADDDDGVRLVVLTPHSTHSRNDEHSPARKLAASILSQRHGGPRLNRNLLVFSAADATRLGELRASARSYLAWRSIVDDSTLDLTEYQKRQAQTRVAETSQQVDSQIAETFIHVLVPSQKPGTADVEWQTTTVRPNADVSIAARVSKRLCSDEALITGYAGTLVKIDLDGRNDRSSLWSERGDITVGELWETYARFAYMPRLASFDVLAEAISSGTASISWAQETFGYADAHDGDTWVGVQAGAHVALVARSGLVIHPDHVPKQPETAVVDEDDDDGSGSGDVGEGASDGQAGDDGEDRVAAPAPPTRFYAHFELDPVRWIKDLGDISDHILAHLGPDVEELSLEIRVRNDDGYDEATRRTVSENAANLNARTSEFD